MNPAIRRLGLPLLAAAAVSLAITGCDKLFQLPPGQLNAVEGVYQGSLTDTTNGGSTTLTAIIDNSGHAKIALTNGTSNTGGGGIFDVPSLQPQNGQFNTSFTLYPPTIRNNNSAEQGTLAGSVSQSNNSRRIVAGFNAQNIQDKGTIALNLNLQQYQLRASMQIITGSYQLNYIDATGVSVSANVSIDTNGSISGNDSSGCNYSGTINVPDADHNIYRGTLTRDCSSQSISYDVLGTYYPLNNTGSAGRLLLLATDATHVRGVQFVLQR